MKLRVTNCAGLFVTLETTPVLFDENLPVAGQVKDGLDFTSDLLWFNDTSKIEGMNLSVRFVIYWYLFLKSISQILKVDYFLKKTHALKVHVHEGMAQVLFYMRIFSKAFVT